MVDNIAQKCLQSMSMRTEWHGTTIFADEFRKNLNYFGVALLVGERGFLVKRPNESRL